MAGKEKVVELNDPPNLLHWEVCEECHRAEILFENQKYCTN